jgi:prevent-host-death family protein
MPDQIWRQFEGEKRHTVGMEVGIKELRDHLSRYLEAVREGREVTVTDHGKAVALLVPLDRPRPLDRLVAEGLVTPARVPKRSRPGATIVANGTVSDLVAEQRQ